MNPTTTQNPSTNLTGANGEQLPTFRGPEYYRNLNTTFNTPGNQVTPPVSIPSNTPPVIPLQTATNTTPSLNLPGQSTQNTGSASGLNAAATTAITNLGQLGNVAQNSAQQYQTAEQNRNLGVNDLISKMGTLQDQLGQQYGLDTKTEAFNQAQQASNAIDFKTQDARKAIENDTSMTLASKGDALRELERTSSIEKTDAAIKLSLATGSLNVAKDLIKQKYDLQIEPLKIKVDNLKYIAENNKDLMTADRQNQLNYLIKKEDRAYQAAKDAQDRISSFALEAYKNGNPQLASDILKSGNLANAFKIAANSQAKQTGIDPKVAEKIVESKVGQKVNATIDFNNALNDYKTAYKKYYDEGSLKSLDAINQLGTLSEGLKTKYAVANGQGAISDGDRASYNKIVGGGIFLPEITLKQLDQLSSSVNSTINNDIKFLDAGYKGQASQFFEPQRAKIEAQNTVEVKDVAQKYPEEFKASINNFFKIKGTLPTLEQQQQIANYISQNK